MIISPRTLFAITVYIGFTFTERICSIVRFIHSVGRNAIRQDNYVLGGNTGDCIHASDICRKLNARLQIGSAAIFIILPMALKPLINIISTIYKANLHRINGAHCVIVRVGTHAACHIAPCKHGLGCCAETHNGQLPVSSCTVTGICLQKQFGSVFGRI